MDYEYCGYEIQVEHVKGDIFAFIWRPGSKLEWGPPVVSVPISKGVGALLNFAKIRIREDVKNRRQGAWRRASAACRAKKSETPSSPRHHLAVDDGPAARKACERLDDARHAARLGMAAPGEEACSTGIEDGDSPVAGSGSI